MNASTDPRAEQVIGATRDWVEKVVIGLELCPFARRELVADRVRFSFTDAADEESLLHALARELRLLLEDPSIETSLLIHPEVLARFADYNAFLDRVDALIEDMGLDGVFQAASFHPQYRFDGTALHAAENYSNRSPYPMLHLLREESVARAVASYPDVAAIPARNVETLKAMGAAAIRPLIAR